MSAGDILVIAFFIFFCIDVAGSIVFMFLNYLNRKRNWSMYAASSGERNVR